MSTVSLPLKKTGVSVAPNISCSLTGKTGDLPALYSSFIFEPRSEERRVGKEC